MKYLIGIDPGVKTGLSIYNATNKEIVGCKTFSIISAMDFILKYRGPNRDIEIYFEDARLRKWIPRDRGREVLQNVGSVKRDCGIWEEFCKFHSIKYYPIAPKNNMTKLDAKTFSKITGWQGRTSEHARDSAMLVFGR